MIMRLPSLLGKMLGEIRRQILVHHDEDMLNDKQLDMHQTITRVYRQQKNHLKGGDSSESIPKCIVNLTKPHIRLIVRGKETKTRSTRIGSCCLMFHTWNVTLREWWLQT